jgi:hypothetical protein
MWDWVDEMKVCDWEEVNGKELTLVNMSEDGTSVLIGVDKQAGIIYLLGIEEE